MQASPERPSGVVAVRLAALMVLLPSAMGAAVVYLATSSVVFSTLAAVGVAAIMWGLLSGAEATL